MKKITVLILDDDEELGYNLNMFLEDEGFSCYSVNSSEKAIEMIKDNHIDIVIVDIRLHGLSGEELIPLIHSIKPEIRFIIHTGSNDFKVSEQLLSIGLTDDDVFKKPLEDMSRITGKIFELCYE